MIPAHSLTKKRKKGRAVAFVVIMLTTAFSILATAQPKKGAGKPPTTAAPKKPPATPKEDLEAGTTPMAGKEAAEPVNAPGAKDAGKGGSVIDQKTLDGGQRVFRFGEVEVEGRLKSPQIVYFLRRVRAEFNAGDLGHRSFMRELSETKNEPSF